MGTGGAKKMLQLLRLKFIMQASWRLLRKLRSTQTNLIHRVTVTFGILHMATILWNDANVLEVVTQRHP